jgi:hypothetical protein
MSRRGGPVTGWITLAALVVCLVAATIGCRSRTAEDFIPSPEASRAAVQATLDAWREGRREIKPIVSNGDHVRIELTDNYRTPGRAISEFQILGETPATNARAFVVKLQLTNPTEEVKCRYLVVGIDPLWVFRQEDYDMLAHWDHVMPAEEDADVEEPQGEADQDP